MLQVTRISLLLIVFITKTYFASTDSPLVETSLGNITGSYKLSTKGKNYSAFEGIPFAKPPIGDLRFEDPQPVEAWTQTLNATTSRLCAQANYNYITKILGAPIGTEDCLYLNVYVPSNVIDTTKYYDVLVYIHGGAFMTGSGRTANSDYMIDNDYILVSFNYRVNILGFLSTEDDVITGNFGLKDQVLALKWVQSHISSFGGNPNSVTIAGPSSGGASVHFHYFSPLSTGLFHKGISQSGTVLDPWAIKENPLKNARKLAAALNCSTASTTAIKTCLKSQPVTSLTGNLPIFYGFRREPFSTFAPVIEKKHTNAFLTQHPYLTLRQYRVANLPWIVSTTTNEGIFPTFFYTSNQDIQEINSRWNDVAPYLLDYNETISESRKANVSSEIRTRYLSRSNITASSLSYVQIFTDRVFGIGSELAAKLQSLANEKPVYYALFNYVGDITIPGYKDSNSSVQNVVPHGNDAIYCFGLLFRNPSDSDKAIGDGCLGMLNSFVRNGTAKYLTSDWQPTKGYNLTYLNITSQSSVNLEKTDDLRPLGFWSLLGIFQNEFRYPNINLTSTN